MTKQIMKLSVPYNGTWKIIRDDKDIIHQYHVYYETYEHRKLMQKYTCVLDCLRFVTQQVSGHEWIMTERKVERIR